MTTLVKALRPCEILGPVNQEHAEPGGRAAAPDLLRLVQDFVNTTDREDGIDRIDQPDSLRAWLIERGLLNRTAHVVDADHRRAIAVREALRSLALVNNGRALDPSTVEVLNDVPEARSVRVHFDPMGAAGLEASGGTVDDALFTILTAVYLAMATGEWSRLKACRRDVCHWAFFDRSRNSSSVWCAMAVCGNRTKTNDYYRRRKAKA